MMKAGKGLQKADELQAVPVRSLYLELSRLGRQEMNKAVREKMKIIVDALYQEKTDTDPLSFHVSHSVMLSKRDASLLFSE